MNRALLAVLTVLVLGVAAAPASAEFGLVRVWGNEVASDGSTAAGQFGTGRPTAAQGGDRQFDDPGGVAVDSAGIVYVADPSNHRINRYDASGRFLGSFGRHGFDPGGTRVAGVGRLNLPEGLATSGGRLYVADNRNDRVVVWTTKGKWISRLARRGAAKGRTTSPWGVALSSGILYVIDQANERINRYSTSGRSLGSLGVFGLGNGAGFVSPYAIAVDAKRKIIYVTDSTADRVLIYRTTGRYLTSFGAPGFSVGQFDRPTGVALDSAGDVYVADYCNQRIVHYAPGGAGVKEVIGGDTVEAPTFMAFGPKGDLYVADHHRMMEFSPGARAAVKRPPVARAAHRLGSSFC
jgi:DNA-binding beta-propeller fold protein YncE